MFIHSLILRPDIICMVTTLYSLASSMSHLSLTYSLFSLFLSSIGKHYFEWFVLSTLTLRRCYVDLLKKE